MSRLEVQFEKVTASTEQIDVLFNLLSERLYRISHKDVSYSEHERFVCSHPYRMWFLVKIKDEYVGSFYISRENTIGINVAERCTHLVIAAIVKFVESNYQPLAAIPSVRSGKFAINVPSSNRVLAEALDDIGSELVQVTYYLPS